MEKKVFIRIALIVNGTNYSQFITYIVDFESDGILIGKLNSSNIIDDEVISTLLLWFRAFEGKCVVSENSVLPFNFGSHEVIKGI